MDKLMKCYLCSHSDFHILPGSVRDNPSLQICECVNCGLVALSSFQHIEPGHYEESGMHDEGLPSIESWLRQTEEDDRRRFEMLKATLANRKVLDFGCGAAGFLRNVQTLASALKSRVSNRSAVSVSIGPIRLSFIAVWQMSAADTM
jgi:hypothetical protein